VSDKLCSKEQSSEGDYRKSKDRERGNRRCSTIDGASHLARGSGPAVALELNLLVDYGVVGSRETTVALDIIDEARALEDVDERIDERLLRNDRVGSAPRENPADPVVVRSSSQCSISNISSNLSSTVHGSEPTGGDAPIVHLNLLLDSFQDTGSHIIGELEGSGRAPRQEAPGKALTPLPPVLCGKSREDHCSRSIEGSIAIDWGQIPTSHHGRKVYKPVGTRNSRHVGEHAIDVEIAIRRNSGGRR